MIDNYRRDINYLRISVTDRCNLRCSYCMPKEGISQLGHDDILRYEEMLRIIKVAAATGITKVRITGGEPLVRRGVVAFISSVTALGALKDVSLTTNGLLLEQYAEGLFAAGIRRINISLDSLKEDRYRQITGGGDIKSVLRGIEAVRQRGFSPIKINIVVLKGVNDDEVLDFARLTVDHPYQVRFIELMPLGTAGDANNGRHLPNSVVKERIESLGALEAISGSDGAGPARLYRLAGAKGQIGFISPISRHFCHQCNRLRLTADGHLRACLLSDEETDLKESLRAGCSDDQIAGLIRETVRKKPKGHDLCPEKVWPRKCAKEMAAIGG